MKYQAFLFFWLALVSGLSAQSIQNVDSKITHVTVYRQGAQVTRSANVNLPKGETELLFSKLSFQLQEKSIQFKIDPSVMVVSISQEVDYLDEATTDSLILGLKQQQFNITDSIQILNLQSEVFKRERELLLANQSLAGANGVSVAELESAAELFRTRLLDIEAHLQRIRTRTMGHKKKLVRLARQLLELNVKSEAPPEVTIKVKVSALSAGTAPLELQYVVPKAGWDPFYNIRVEGTQSPITLDYKAKVYQDAGEDWSDSRLTLSTGNPAISNVKPGLSPYYLTYNNYYATPSRPSPGIYSRTQKVTGTVIDASTGEPLIGATILIKGTTSGAVTDFDGKFEMEAVPGQSVLVVSYLGYSNQEYRLNGVVADIRMTGDNAALDEVVVMGSRSSRQEMSRPKPQKPAPVPIAIEKRQTSTEFEIDIPYSIPADKKPYDVHMATYEVPASYHYALVPKLSKEAYLIAKITDWSKYSLLNGDANLFFKGTYQGNTYLDMAAFEDTLSLSVGRDADIIVKRELERNASNQSFLGSNKTVERSWKTTIRNTNDYPVSLKVEDQYPVPKADDIKVIWLGHDGAQHNEKTGAVTWSVTLPAGATAERTLKYAVRFPKKKRLLVD